MKFGVGDKVRIVNYGHNIWINVNGKFYDKDIAPYIVGKEGIISEITDTQGIPQYAIDGIKWKHAWYNKDQLEMINQNQNNAANIED